MKLPRANFCRWAAGVFLAAAFLMMVLGLTLFSHLLKEIDFLTYWLICFLFTGLAAIFAMTDMAAIRRKSRDEQRDLIKDTFEQTKRDSDEPRQSNPDS